VGNEATLAAVKPLSLVGMRDGKHSIRWVVLLARCAVYFVIVGVGVYLVTWISDRITQEHDSGNLTRLVSISGFLAVLFVVSDVRRDLKLPSKDLPDLDGGAGSGSE
jgi:Kef-type K+ transport system membrane component KefB